VAGVQCQLDVSEEFHEKGNVAEVKTSLGETSKSDFLTFFWIKNILNSLKFVSAFDYGRAIEKKPYATMVELLIFFQLTLFLFLVKFLGSAFALFVKGFRFVHWPYEGN
jgi:hypothetical protein